MRAGAAAQAVGDEILKDLSADPSVDPKNKPAVHVSKVMTSRTRTCWTRSKSRAPSRGTVTQQEQPAPPRVDLVDIDLAATVPI